MNYRIAFLQGANAAENKWERISPYTNRVDGVYWLAGYDGLSYKQAMELHEEAKESRRMTKVETGYARIGLNRT